MKHAIVLLALALSFQAQAKINCKVNVLTAKNEYGRILHEQDLDQPILLAIKNGQAHTFEFNEAQDWRSLDKSLFVSVVNTANGTAISLGRIDLSRKNDALPIDQITVGTVTKDKALGVEFRKNKLNVMCFEL